MTAISVDKLCFSRGRRQILHDLTFSVGSGDFVSIVGQNGAGKTTLLKCLCRILPMGSGSVGICDREVGVYSQRELARHISYLPQSDHRVPQFAVAEYVAMGRYPHLSPFASMTAADVAAVQTAAERAGILHLMDRELEALSGGERQKALIAAALAQGAEILLLDEPISFLDPKHAVEVYALLRQLNADGVTIVMVTHDLNGTARHASRVLALKDGRIAFDGSRDAFVDPVQLEAVFDVPFRVVADGEVPILIPGARP